MYLILYLAFSNEFLQVPDLSLEQMSTWATEILFQQTVHLLTLSNLV